MDIYVAGALCTLWLVDVTMDLGWRWAGGGVPVGWMTSPPGKGCWEQVAEDRGVRLQVRGSRESLVSGQGDRHGDSL